jgi:hypothetical protein
LFSNSKFYNLEIADIDGFIIEENIGVYNYIRMNRRKFLKRAGLSGASLGILGGVIGVGGSVYSIGDSIEIRLFQTEEISQYLREEALGEDFWVSTLTYKLPRIYERSFDDLSVDVSVGNLDVDIETTAEVPYSGVGRVKEIAKWGSKAQKDKNINPVKHSNILLREYDFEKYSYAGYGISGIMPSCCRLYNGYASMWLEPEETDVQRLITLAAHEVGHNLGLTHYHSSNVRSRYNLKQDSIMMSRIYAKNNEKNIFGEDIEFTGRETTKFNDKLDIGHLRI